MYNRLTSKIDRARISRFIHSQETDRLTLEVGAAGGRYGGVFPHRIAGDIVFFPSLDLIFDAHHIPFPDGAFPVVLCVEVLEHCKNPHQVISEFFRVLEPGGKLILSTRFIFPIHEAPHDYFRFTEYGLKMLCGEFSSVEIVREVPSLGALAVLTQRLALQTRWRIPKMHVLLHAIAKLLLRLQWLVTEEYGNSARTVTVDTLMTSGYYVVAIK